MGSFQTPEVTHEENWWQIVQLAYTQLYLSRDACQLIPKSWERYLPKFKQYNKDTIADEVSPSLAQRYFPKIIDQIGTPAHEVKRIKPGKGRENGDGQEKRSVKPIIFKSKKNNQPPEQKQPPTDIHGFEKQLNMLNPPPKKNG